MNYFKSIIFHFYFSQVRRSVRAVNFFVCTFTFILLFLPILADGQSKNESLIEKYDYGKRFFSEGKYKLAAEIFGTIAIKETSNDLPRYARYLQAYSLYKTGKVEQAQFLLEKLIKDNFDWNKIGEAKYLLSITHFDNQNPKKALSVLSQINNSDFRADADTLRRQRLSGYDAEKLESLYATFPNDDILSRLLLDKLKALPAAKRNANPLFETLSARFPEVNTASPDFLPVFKEVYHLAVLLPFNNTQTNSASLSQTDRIAYDLYQGMLVAAEILAEEGIEINLHAFDTRRDSAHTAAILQDSLLLNADLIVGPLYANTVSVVADYSRKHQIPMLNPISTNSIIITDNPNAFLLYPSSETQGKKMAAFSLSHFKDSEAYIVYGKTPHEEKMAEAYQKYLIDRGAVIRQFEGFDYSKKGYQKLLKSLEKLNAVAEKDEQSLIYTKAGRRRAAHIFAALNDPVSAVSLVSALQTLKAEHVHILAPEKWLDFNQLTYRQLERSKVHIFYPNYPKKDSVFIKKVAHKYGKKMNIPPFNYALDGMEAIYTFGKSLHKHGTGFRSAIHFEGFTPGLVYEGTDYSGANDNQYLPVYVFRNGKFVHIFPEKQIGSPEKQTEQD